MNKTFIFCAHSMTMDFVLSLQEILSIYPMLSIASTTFKNTPVYSLLYLLKLTASLLVYECSDAYIWSYV